MIFGAVELIADFLSHAANSVGELINYGIEKRYCRGKKFATLDCTPVAFDRIGRSLASGNHHAFGHDKTQSHKIFAWLCELLLQVRQNAHKLIADYIQSQVPVRASQHVTCEF